MFFRLASGSGRLESRSTNHETRFCRGAIAGLALLAALVGDLAAADFVFGALGDLPYSGDEEDRFPGLVADMSREDLAFVVHVGDFKSAVTTCSDEIFLQRREWFDRSRHPFVFVPGDNEWVDCGRPLFAGRDPLERLARLRELFFSGDTSLGQRKLRLERQPPAGASAFYPEHARWTHDRVLFLTLNAPGPHNHPRTGEFPARSWAVRQWISDSFAAARARGLGGVVLFMHADPWNGAGEPRRGYATLLETLAAEARAFEGEVLLVNGDSHRYRVDRWLRDPATGAPLGNFQRVNVFGSPSMRWVRIRVTEDGGRVKFEASPGD